MMASEMGVLTIPEDQIITKWRLQPGKMLLVDLEQGRLIPDDEIKAELAKSHPYKEWLERPRSCWKSCRRSRPRACAPTCRCSIASRRSATARKTSPS